MQAHSLGVRTGATQLPVALVANVNEAHVGLVGAWRGHWQDREAGCRRSLLLLLFLLFLLLLLGPQQLIEQSMDNLNESSVVQGYFSYFPYFSSASHFYHLSLAISLQLAPSCLPRFRSILFPLIQSRFPLFHLISLAFMEFRPASLRATQRNGAQSLARPKRVAPN